MKNGQRVKWFTASWDLSYLHFDGTASDRSNRLPHKINVYLCGIFLQFSQNLQVNQVNYFKFDININNFMSVLLR